MSSKRLGSTCSAQQTQNVKHPHTSPADVSPSASIYTHPLTPPPPPLPGEGTIPVADKSSHWPVTVLSSVLPESVTAWMKDGQRNTHTQTHTRKGQFRHLSGEMWYFGRWVYIITISWRAPLTSLNGPFLILTFSLSCRLMDSAEGCQNTKALQVYYTF